MKPVLAPLDFSMVSEDVIRRAMQLARALDVKLWLLHVAPPDPDFVGYEPGPQVVRDQLAERYHEEHQRLEALDARVREQGVETEALLIQGPTARKIVDEARRLEADWIVMGSHGHGALRHLLVGSVTEEVLRHAPCPVVLVPAHPPAL